MNRSKIILPLAIVASVLSLILGLAINQEFERMLLPLMLGVLWVITLYQKWVWGPTVCAFGLLLYASILQRVDVIWLFICLFTSLIAWDLSYFRFDIQIAEFIHQGDALEREHLKRLGAVMGLSIVFLWISRKISLNLQFGWVLLLGLVLILGLSRVILLIRASTSYFLD